LTSKIAETEQNISHKYWTRKNWTLIDAFGIDAHIAFTQKKGGLWKLEWMTLHNYL